MPSGIRERASVLRGRAARFSRRAPGQLVIALTVLVLVCLASGVASALDVQRRRDVVAGVADRSGPLIGAALAIYQSLSDANATAAGAFLVGGAEPADLRKRYEDDITRAAAAITTAAAGTQSPEQAKSAETVTQLAAYLPVYTGLVEQGRALNRQAVPFAATYLREAAYLVRGRMLNWAKELYDAETTRLADAHSATAVVGWLFLALGLVALGGLIAVQIYLARMTKRTLNAGLLMATAAAVAAVSWYIIGTASAADHSSASQRQSTSVGAFAQARIKLLQARSDEALMLAARGNGRSFDDDFRLVKGELDGQPGKPGLLSKAEAAASDPRAVEAVRGARKSWAKWDERHDTVRLLDSKGEFDEAVRQATGSHPDGTATLSSTVDDELGKAIRYATDQFDRDIAQARNALASADIGVVALMILAAFGVGVGFAPRLREFR